MRIRILDETRWADIERLMDHIPWCRDEDGMLAVSGQDFDSAAIFLKDMGIEYEEV